jgi:hypothetical protein
MTSDKYISASPIFRKEKRKKEPNKPPVNLYPADKESKANSQVM